MHLNQKRIGEAVLRKHFSRRYLTNPTSPRLASFRAAAVEEELRQIANKQQVNVDKLVELVKENEIILQKMRVSIRPSDN